MDNPKPVRAWLLRRPQLQTPSLVTPLESNEAERARKLIQRMHTVDAGSGCWVWNGTRAKNDYGMAFIGRNRYQAHRLSYACHMGPIESGMLVCHRCDNRPCVNPAHLFIGTHSDNWNDYISKGRHKLHHRKETCPRGEESHKAKLTNAQVGEIISMATSGVPRVVIAERFGISVGYVSDIKCGKWRTDSTHIKR